MTEVWSKWESQVINGAFPLRRFLGKSNHSVVFLTEHRAQDNSHAAIKLVPAGPASNEAQLVRWRAVAGLYHPHLMRLFDVGRCQLGGHPFLFVVMEYAEETLAQVLPDRALNVNEVREMLLPTLDALAFLHRQHLVHGHLKPPNFLVVGDRLKLATDTIRPAGRTTASVAKPSLYEPPEAKDGGISMAGDMWGLGVTLVEALTQRTPTWPDERSDLVLLPANFPSSYVDIVRRCLSRNPANRPTVTDLQGLIKQAPVVPVAAPPASTPAPAPAPSPIMATPVSAAPVSAVPVSELAPSVAPTASVPATTTPPIPPVAAPTRVAAPIPPVTAPTPPVAALSRVSADETPTHAIARREPDKRRLVLAIIALVVLGLIAAAVRFRVMQSNRNALESASPSARSLPEQAAAPAGPANPPAAASTPNAAVSEPEQPRRRAVSGSTHEEIPVVPRSVRAGIHGHIKVAVRVTVDRSGNVVAKTLTLQGPSRYFARLAMESASKWKFAADPQDARKWLLQFEFTRGGTTAHAVASRS